MARKIEIKNEEILESLLRKDKMVEEVLKIEKEAETLTNRGKEIQVEYDALHSRLVREDEKTRPLLMEEKDKIKLDEYEEVSRVYLGKDEDAGKVFIEVANRLEEFKAFYQNDKAKKDNGGSDTPKDGDITDDTGIPAELSEKSGDL